MKKIFGLILCFLIFLCINHVFQIHATSEDYTTYVEIMLNEGKLMNNFTDEEMCIMYNQIKGSTFMDVKVHEENKNIEGTYISNTLYSVENKGSTDVTYEILVDVETTNKVSFNASGSLNGSVSSGKSGGVKEDIGAKCGLEVTSSTTSSRKEKQTMKFSVEGGSRAIVYLTGNLSVTNGVAVMYVFWIKKCEGAFEIVTLKNQYARMEKVAI